MMAANYRHIGCLENRLGRHYSRFSASGPAAPLAAQSLARRKSPNHGSNRRSQANETPPTRAAIVEIDVAFSLHAGDVGSCVGVRNRTSPTPFFATR